MHSNCQLATAAGQVCPRERVNRAITSAVVHSKAALPALIAAPAAAAAAARTAGRCRRRRQPLPSAPPTVSCKAGRADVWHLGATSLGDSGADSSSSSSGDEGEEAPCSSTSYYAEASISAGRVVIRPATQDDARGAAVVLTRAFAGQPGGIPINDVADYVQEMLAAPPRGLLLVAWLDPVDEDVKARVIATAALSLSEDTRERFPTLQPPADQALLANVSVDFKFRRQGIARRLLAAVEQVAAAAGMRYMYLHVRLADEAAQALYVKEGYQEVARDNMLAGLRGIIPRALLRKDLQA